jgi:hypothetical protein
MKQTAVQWLVQKLTNRQNGVYDGFPILSLDEIYKQALEMEKEQMIDAFQDSRILSITNNCNSGETYYKQTYED